MILASGGALAGGERAPTRAELEIQPSGPVRVERSFDRPAFAGVSGNWDGGGVRRYYYARPYDYLAPYVVVVEPYAPFGFHGPYLHAHPHWHGGPFGYGHGHRHGFRPPPPHYGPHGHGRFLGRVPLRWLRY